MKNELIELYQKTIPTQNLELIPLEFLCEYFSIGFERQYRDLDNNKSFDGLLLKEVNEEVFGDKRKRGHLNKKGFIKWIIQLNPILINELLRDTFVDYQNNLVDYLYDNAIQQETVLKTINALKSDKNELYRNLILESEDFRKFVDLGAEIMRLGKTNKAIQDKIAGGSQVELDFSK
jgi:hypothetical protein